MRAKDIHELKINELNKELMQKAKMRIDNLSKPLGSLGKLEKIAERIVGITESLTPKVDKKVIVVFCADNGVATEGVSTCPKHLTVPITYGVLNGIAGISVLSKFAGAELMVVDIGVDGDIVHPRIINKKIRKSTWNILYGRAMEEEEAVEAINKGIEIVKCLKEKGINLIGTGEVGIGNTTTSSAVSAVLTGECLEIMVGKGAGLKEDGVMHKINIIKKAIEVNNPNSGDPIDVLAKVGGFDIAGMVGLFIGAALHKIPIVIDGFISATAALVAYRINSKVREYMIPSHSSQEPGSKIIMETLGFKPMLNLDMRLGEGTGAAISFHVIDAAITLYNNMGTFEDAKIEEYIPIEWKQ